MKNLLFIGLMAFTMFGCTHIQLSGWEGDTFELCCSGSCGEKEIWDKKNKSVCSGSTELLSGNNRSEVLGIHTHRTKRFSHSQLTRRDIHCRRYRCSGKVIPTID